MNRIRQCPALAADTPDEIKHAFVFLWEMAGLADSAVKRELLSPPPGREPPMTDGERREAMSTLLIAFADFLERINLDGAGSLCQDMADALRDLNRGGKRPLLTRRKGAPNVKANDEMGRYYAVIALEIRNRQGETLDAAIRDVVKAFKVEKVELTQRELTQWRKTVRAQSKEGVGKLFFEADAAGNTYESALSQALRYLGG